MYSRIYFQTEIKKVSIRPEKLWSAGYTDIHMSNAVAKKMGIKHLAIVR